jgi:long-chain acyl-CoA synthetase
VYGDSLQDKLVAIIVPDEETVQAYAAKPENAVSGSPAVGTVSLADLIKDPSVVRAIERGMTALGVEAKLKGFEKVKAFHLESEPFSVENGLLTPTFKLKRNPARDHYRPVIDQLYAKINAPKAKL